MSQGARIAYKSAFRIASYYLEDLRPFCERIEFAGSLRRRSPMVGDAEIVMIPKVEEERDMFGDVINTKSLLEEALPSLLKKWDASTTLNGPKQKKVIFRVDTFPLDLFIVKPETWGVLFTLRTGPEEYGHWLVTKKMHNGAMPDGMYVREGRLYDGSLSRVVTLDTPEEEDFFKAIGLEWKEPSERKVPWK